MVMVTRAAMDAINIERGAVAGSHVPPAVWEHPLFRLSLREVRFVIRYLKPASAQTLSAEASTEGATCGQTEGATMREMEGVAIGC